MLACSIFTALPCPANPLARETHRSEQQSAPGAASDTIRITGVRSAVAANATPSDDKRGSNDSPPLGEHAATAGDGSTNGSNSDNSPESSEGEQPAEIAASTQEVPSDRALQSNDPEQPQQYVEDVEVGTAAPATPPVSLDVAVGLAWWFVQRKAIFGPNFRIGGRWVWFAAETNLVLVTRSTPSFGHTLLGASFGTYLEISPLRTRRLEAHVGLGSDYHWLPAINPEEWKFAFAARASLHAWLGEHVGMFIAGRGYLAKSDGLGLGISDRGVSQFPLLFSAGLEWRP